MATLIYPTRERQEPDYGQHRWIIDAEIRRQKEERDQPRPVLRLPIYEVS